jgi:hypothetical protein
MAKRLIIGAGVNGKPVAEAAELNGLVEVVGFVDDALGVRTLVLGYPVFGSAAELTGHTFVCDQVLVAAGNNAFRASLTDRLLQAGLLLATWVYSKAMGVALCPNGRSVCRHGRRYCGHCGGVGSRRYRQLRRGGRPPFTR